MPRLNTRLVQGLCLGLCTLVFAALLAAPARAGESTAITGFDRWTLGTPMPAEGDDFYTTFSGPMSETLGDLELVEYETTYELTMPSGVRNARVTVGYGPEGLLEVIIVDMGVLDEALSSEQAEAYAYDIISVLQGEYSPELLLIDAFPGGPDRSEEADENSGSYVLGDENHNSIWLTWSGSTLQTMYAAEDLSMMLVEQTFGPVEGEDEAGE